MRNPAPSRPGLTRPTISQATWTIATILQCIAIQNVVAQNKANTWEIVGETGVSAMQLFRGKGNKVYILDKVENNPATINGHPAWATEYDTTTNRYRIQDVVTNTFCAGGNVLGNGTWAVFGGNKAVTWGGLDGPQGGGPFDNYNGGTAIRLIDPCADQTCEYSTSQQANMQSERWYPTVETLQDGSLAILGGMRDGGYVNTEYADNPTIEYFPSKGPQIGLNILAETLPCNLYPLTWLLPSGNLLIQSNLKTSLLDWRNNIEHALPDIPHAVRVYPASGASAMLPLTPANNWTATMIFCGGTDLQPNQWMTSPNWNVAAYPTDDTCVSITPDISSEWDEEDKLFEGRSMGQLILLPDGRLFHLNGVATGTAGYGNTSWAIGQSYGDNPLMTSAYYDHSAPKGRRWSRPSDLQEMSVVRAYHSTTTLMNDGSLFNAGSNPNVDYIPYKGFVDESGVTYTYPTEYRAETFYPDYYDKPRPSPSGLPETLTYGGNYFNITLSAEDLNHNASSIDSVKVVVMRTGYSTHGMNMGMRMVQLNSTWTLNVDAENGNGNGNTNGLSGGTIHCSQMPPNAGIMAPGPAVFYVLVEGVPSIGVDVMVGDGKIGEQELLPVQELPGTMAQSGVTITASGKIEEDDEGVNGKSRNGDDSKGAATHSMNCLRDSTFILAVGVCSLVRIFLM